MRNQLSRLAARGQEAVDQLKQQQHSRLRGGRWSTVTERRSWATNDAGLGPPRGWDRGVRWGGLRRKSVQRVEAALKELLSHDARVNVRGSLQVKLH